MNAFEGAALLVLFTFLPPLFFAWRLRSAERHGREPWPRILAAFAWGAFAAILIAGFAEEYLLKRYFGADEPVVVLGLATVSILSVVIAPIVEELSKALGLAFFKDASPEPENGYIYGGAVGLGFAASENLLYVAFALFTAGSDAAILVGVYRGIATVALHAGATAISGYGVWRFRFATTAWRRATGAVLLPAALAVAILVHAAYNLIAQAEVGALFALVFAVGVFAFVRARVRRMDAGAGA